MYRWSNRYLLALVGLAVSGCSGGGSAVPNAQAASSTSTSIFATPQKADHAATATKSIASASVTGFSDTFSEDAVGSAAQGWDVLGGKWDVCQQNSAHAYCQTTNGTGESLAGSTAWANYSVSAVVTDPSQGAYGSAGIIGRVTGLNEFYGLELRPQLNGTAPYWYLTLVNHASMTVLASGPLKSPDTNTNYRLNLAFSGTQITASVAFDGGTTYNVLATVNDSTYPAGQIGVRTTTTAAASFGNVVVTLPNAGLVSESAISSNTFVNSIAMNADYGASYYAQIKPLIGNLGIHYYRVSAATILDTPTYVANLTDLYHSFGTTFDVLSDQKTTPASVVKAIAMLPVGSVTSVEGPNETDNPGQGSYYDPKFATDIPVYMQSLYTTIKSTPATANLPVIGPSFANSATSYTAVGNISADVDYGNTHDYFAGFNPGTGGWGGSNSFAPGLYYGSIPWSLAACAQATGTKPVIATETGYYTAPVHSGVPLSVQAKYVPRLYLEQYRGGIPRSFIFELMDSNMATGAGSFGMVSPSYVPNPAYVALAGMISMLKDTGISSAPMTYNWGMTGQITNVHHLLMHKADGTLVLPLWIETESFDPNANNGVGQTLTVPAQKVTVSFGQGAATAKLWTYSIATGQWSSSSLTTTNGSATLSVTDTVSVLEVPPS